MSGFRHALIAPLALACLLTVPALLPRGAAAAQEVAALELSSFPRATLQIVHRDRTHAARRHSFEVWVADTPARAQQGLMFVRDLPATRGMLFPLSPPRVETMWMKNTYIELDMLFIDAGGRISKILRRARPLSLEILSSEVPVQAVVELRGGEAEQRSLAVGDRVSWTGSGASRPPR